MRWSVEGFEEGPDVAWGKLRGSGRRFSETSEGVAGLFIVDGPGRSLASCGELDVDGGGALGSAGGRAVALLAGGRPAVVSATRGSRRLPTY